MRYITLITAFQIYCPANFNLYNYRQSKRMSRPIVSVFDTEAADSVVGTVTLPAVFTAPIRSDVVHYVHTLMAKNKRQAYAVSQKAGHQVRY